MKKVLMTMEECQERCNKLLEEHSFEDVPLRDSTYELFDDQSGEVEIYAAYDLDSEMDHYPGAKIRLRYDQGEMGYERTFESPLLFKDVLLFAAQGMRLSGDYHHRFLEGFNRIGPWDGTVTTYELVFGS